MDRLWHRLRRSRLVGEFSLTLEGALVGAAAGVVISTVAAVRLAPDTLPVDRLRVGAAGLGFGFWGGLLFTVGLLLAARRNVPLPPLAAVFRAVAVAGAVTTVAAAIALWAGLAAVAAVAVALVAGTVAARLALQFLSAPSP